MAEGKPTTKRDYVAEITAIRDRTRAPDWENGITQLLFLCVRLTQFEDANAEPAYFPVACVAALETYFRREIQRLIDSGDVRYVNSLRIEETPLKITHDLLLAVRGKRITVGELIAHSVRLSSLEAISKTVGQLLQTDFFSLVKEARDPELRHQHGENAPPVLGSPTDTFARVKRTFELRHIICHEAHLVTPLGLDEARELCSACYDFARASCYGIAYHENPTAPVTLEGAYQAAVERVRTLDGEIEAVEKRILSVIHPIMQNAFQEMQSTWRSFVQREADFNAAGHMNMNRGVLYGLLATEVLYKERLANLRSYADRFKSEEAAHTALPRDD